MTAGPSVPLRACSNTRCKRQVFDAKIIRKRGVPIDVVIDAEPSTWADGARVKLIPSRHLPHQVVEKLTGAQARQGFGLLALYVEHHEVCEAEQRRTRAKKTEGHA